MARMGSFRSLLVATLVGSAVMSAQTPSGQAPPAGTMGTMVEHSSEARFQLDLKVPDAALSQFLPPGFSPNVATQGAAKDCNLRAICIDRVTVNGPDGRPLGKGPRRGIWLAAPVKWPGGTNGQLIIGGLTDDPTQVPGPFGNYLLATSHTMQRATVSPASGTGPTIDSQDWNFT